MVPRESKSERGWKLRKLYKNNNIDIQLINAEAIIETCSNEDFFVPNSKELLEAQKSVLHLDDIIKSFSQDYDVYHSDE